MVLQKTLNICNMEYTYLIYIYICVSVCLCGNVYNILKYPDFGAGFFPEGFCQVSNTTRASLSRINRNMPSYNKII